MSFLERIARRRAREIAAAEAKEEAELEARIAADPHAEPPGHRKEEALAEVEEEAPCPAWVFRAARGELLPGDPGTGPAVEQFGPWPDDVRPVLDRIIGEEEKADGEDCPPTGWDRLEAEDLPPAPFKLQPWVTITDGAEWLRMIRLEVDRGPCSARARTGALQEDLRFLALRLRGDPTEDELRAACSGPLFG